MQFRISLLNFIFPKNNKNTILLNSNEAAK